MQEIKRYRVRGIPGAVSRVSLRGRTIDFWAPEGGSDHLLVAHDGQNIFDKKTATFISTWKLAHTSTRIAHEQKKVAPLIIGVFHSSNKQDPFGRAKDLCPEDPFLMGIRASEPSEITSQDLRGNAYLETIFDEIVPDIAMRTHSQVNPNKTAMIGSSLGGLATLYSAIKHSDKFQTALALSPHWTLAGEPLVDWIIPRLPNDRKFRIWMSRGTKGLDKHYESLQERANRLMIELGWTTSQFKSQVFEGYAHNERSWAKSVSEPLRFWLEGA